MGKHVFDWGNICMGYWIHLSFGFTMLSAHTLGVESNGKVHQSGKTPKSFSSDLKANSSLF